jgi:hypothetical protein
MHLSFRAALLCTCLAVLALAGCGEEPDGGTEPPPDPPAPDISGNWIVVANTTFLGSQFNPGGLPEHCVADATVQITQSGSEFEGQFSNPAVFCFFGAGPGFDGKLTGLEVEGNSFLAQDEDCVYSGLITGDPPDMIEGTLDCTIFMQPQGPERVPGHWRFRRSAATPPNPNLTGDWVLVTEILNPDGVGCQVSGNYRFDHPEGERFSIEITNSVAFCNNILLPDASLNGTVSGGTLDGTTMTIGGQDLQGDRTCDYTGVVSGPPDRIDGQLTCNWPSMLGPEVLTGPLRLRR